MDAIIKLSSMGDIIHSLVVLPKLDKKIDFIVDDSFKDILNYNPHINKIVPIKLRAAKRDKKLFLSEFNKIKTLNYENVYDLQGLLKSAIVAKIIGKNIIGYKNSREKIASLFYNKKIYSKKDFAIERYLELFSIQDWHYLQNHPNLLFYKDKDFDELSNNKQNIIFIIGASWECKKTPISIWKELVKYFKNENIIIPYANEDEYKFALEIAKNSDNIVINKYSLNDLKAIISKANLLIGNDTGPSFIAWANNVNNIILYGCTYNNKIIKNRYSKSVEVQKTINKKLNVIDKLDIKKIIKKVEEF